MVRLLVLQVVVICSLWTATAPSHAQQRNGEERASPSEPGEDGSPDEPTKPETIRASDIAPEAEKAVDRLREVRELLTPNDGVVEIQDTISAVEERVSLLESKTESLSPQSSLYRLVNLHGQWKDVEQELNDWQPLLKEHSDELLGAQADVEALIAF